MRKVLHLISGGDAGGAKTHIYSLMKGLRDKIDAHIICFIRDQFYEEAVREKISIEVMEQKSRFNLSVMKDVSKKMEEDKFDILHCHGARANFNALFINKNIQIPRVTTIHSDYELDFKDNFIKNMIFTPLNTYALKKFPYYIAVTENFKKMLVKRGFPEDRIFVVYNGIDFNKKETMVSKEEFLKRYDIPNDNKILFGIAARLDQVKDHETLLRAIAKAGKKLENARFLLAGVGVERENLEQLAKELEISDRVYFLGQVRDPFSLFNAIDVNMLTSISESFPYAILEGAKCKVPVIATSVGGIPEMIRRDIDGWLFPPRNIEKLSNILISCIERPTENKIRGQNLYENVRDNFTVENMAEKHVEIYNEIIQREGGSK